MGHAAGQLANRLHLLGLAQAFLRAPTFRDVLHGADDLVGPAFAVAQDVCHLVDDDLLPILAQGPVFDAVASVLGDGAGPGAVIGFPIPGMNGAGEGRARKRDLAGLVAEDPEGFVRPAHGAAGEADPAAELHLPAAQLGDLLGGGEAGLALLQSLVAPDEVAHVGADGKNAAVGYPVVPGLQPAAVADLVEEGLACLPVVAQTFLEKLLFPAGGLGEKALGDLFAHQILEGPAQQRRIPRLAEQGAEVTVQMHQPVLGVVDGKGLGNAFDRVHEAAIGINELF